ncbi:MAG: ATP-binding cassette domain-containing protein [Sphaerochaetaceae bacterium]|nr:ATP-binding cassette domain-containing protein [Sphaerochaetaceae bacterium]
MGQARRIMQMPALSVTGLSIGYESRLLSNLSFTVSDKEKVLVIGPNGSGKTTLLKTIAGILKPLAGTIKTDKAHIAYLKQDWPSQEFPISALEVASLASNTARALKMMKATGCAHLAKRSFFSLSGGERQRVSLARCLAQDASLILMDEPSSFLDRESQALMSGFLKGPLLADKAVMLVTHDPSLIQALGWRTIEL